MCPMCVSKMELTISSYEDNRLYRINVFKI